MNNHIQLPGHKTRAGKQNLHALPAKLNGKEKE